MIIKSSQRSSPQELANHLTKLSENENIIFSDSRAILAEDVHGALDDMDDIARGSSCQQHLYHVSINPRCDLNAKEWKKAWQEYEAEFRLENQPFIEVTHVKEGRLHKHRVYERIQDDGKAVHLGFNRIRNEKISRVLEYEFGHELTLGKHNRAVIKKLRAEGKGEIADWLEQQQAHEQSRPVAEKNHADLQQEKRTKLSIEQVKAELQNAYQATDNGRAFEAAIAEKGYLLAKGDKRDFVIVDPVGGVHSPRRRLGVKAKELRQRWQDLNPEQMPTVEQVKDFLSPERQSKREWQQKDTEQKIEDLTEQWSKVQQEIEELNRNLESEEVEQGSTVAAQSNGSTQQPNRPQKSKKNLKQRLFTNHRRNRLAKPVKKRRRASRASTPRTAYQYRKRVWLERSTQELAQPQLHEPIEPTVTPSQTHKEQRISSEVHQRTAETLLPHVLQGADGSQDDDPTITKPQKGQGDKTPIDPAKHQDQRKNIETWTKLRGEGRDSIKPLNREAQPTAQPTIRDRYRTTSETVIPTHKTALTEAGFFDSKPEPSKPTDDFAKIQKNSPSKFSMVWQSVFRKITVSASKSANKYAARRAEKKQQREVASQRLEATKAKERQDKLKLLENKKERGDITKREEKFLQKEHERKLLEQQQQHQTKLKEELQQFYQDNPHLKPDQADEMMARVVGQHTKLEQQQIKQMLDHKQKEEIKRESEARHKALEAYNRQLNVEKSQKIENQHLNQSSDLANVPQGTDEKREQILSRYTKQEQEVAQHKEQEQNKQERIKVYEAKAEQRKEVATTARQKEIDTSLSAYKALENDPGWSAQNRIQQAGKTREWKEAVIKSGHALSDANKHADKPLTPLEEYRAELARTALKHDMTNMERHKNPRNAIETDKTIAFKMYGAGYSKEEVSHAIRQGSPNTANLSAKESHMYVHQQINPVLSDEKSQELRATVNKVREHDGTNPQERRLDQLRLAEDYPSQSQSLEPKTPANTTEAQSESDTGVGY